MTGARAGFRVLLHAATTLAGREVRELLSKDLAFPVAEMILCDPPGREGLLTEFRGAAALSMAFGKERLLGCDLAILCEPQAEDAQVARESGTPSILLDAGEGATGLGPLLHASWGRPPAGAPLVRGTGPTASLLLTILEPLRAMGIREIEGTILLPASGLGREGVEELFAQTQARLTFQEPPQAIFGRTSAFDVFPAPAEGPRAAREIEDVVGLVGGAVRLRALQVPVFHGTSFSIHVRLDRPHRGETEAALRAAPRLRFVSAPSPGVAAEADGILVGAPEGPIPGGWVGLWAVGDALRYGMAANALAIAAYTLGIGT